MEIPKNPKKSVFITANIMTVTIIIHFSSVLLCSLEHTIMPVGRVESIFFFASYTRNRGSESSESAGHTVSRRIKILLRGPFQHCPVAAKSDHEKRVHDLSRCGQRREEPISERSARTWCPEGSGRVSTSYLAGYINEHPPRALNSCGTTLVFSGVLLRLFPEA